MSVCSVTWTDIKCFVFALTSFAGWLQLTEVQLSKPAQLCHVGHLDGFGVMLCCMFAFVSS